MLPGHKVVVESWFDLTGDSPAAAAVTVYRQPDGAVLTEGKLDEKGLFVFTYSQRENLRVVVSAAGGHRKELEIAAAELTGDDSATPAVGMDASRAPSAPTLNASPEPFADRTSRIAIKDVLLGVALLLALGAFGLALSNARKLRALKQTQSEKHDKPVIPPDR